ncbi:hypothetical protein [Streptomyces sp. 2P-4]|uniref:hypothetical protein n=1 Tax=Streptomyces sp. 2P-4 TaxID=2931974 RepID=UPI0025410E33|nr:hypothetical protein [Streptomyces sp. 2P-4]
MDTADTADTADGGPARTREAGPAMLPDEGAMVDEHGRPPGAPSRRGTGSAAPPADPERYAAANAGPDPPTALERPAPADPPDPPVHPARARPRAR